MIHNEFEDKEFDKDEYKRDLEYEEWWEGEKGREWRNIERAINQIEDEEFRKKIEKLRKKSREYTKDEKWELVDEFGELKKYEDKLNFWIEKGLSLLNTKYFEDLEGFKNIMLIDPTNDEEKSIYLIKLTEWINIINEEEKDKSYQTLIEEYNKADRNKKFIKEQIEIADNSVENIMREFGLEANLINNFLSMYKQKKNPNWYGLSNHCLMPLGFKIIAYKTSKVIGFVKYKEFLKEELKSINEIEEEVKEELDNVVNTPKEENNIISKNRTFKRVGEYENDEKLRALLNKLIEKGFIKKIDFKYFIKVFDFQPIELVANELSPKIIWKYTYKNSKEQNKSYDWKELLTLIEYITNLEKKDFSKNNKEIRDIIMCCFNFDDDSMTKKQNDILKRINNFVKSKSNKKTKIEELIDKLIF